MVPAELRAIVVDDEPLAREHLRHLLEKAEGVRWEGEAPTASKALELVARISPDVVFLDISMPGLSGLDLATRLERRVHVVFTTAYDAHAVTAFDLHAADYLLKPLGQKRVQQAVDRVRELAGLGPAAAAPRLYVKERGRIVPVSMRDIERLEASGDYVVLHSGGRAHLVTGALKDLLARLPAGRFLRVHRSHAVNVEHVLGYEPVAGGRLSLAVTGGATVPVSRSRARSVREALRDGA